MKSSWLKGENPDEIKVLFKSSKTIREKIVQLIGEKIKETVYVDDYDNPSWSHRQADRNGYNRALIEIIELLKD